MRPSDVLAALLLASCGSSHGAAPDGPPGDAPPDALPVLVSTATACGSGPCAQIDLAHTDHTIAPELFGDGIEWANRGQDVLLPDPTGQTAGTLRPDVMTALAAQRFTVMRYPGGTLADMFHWQQAVGPVAQRTAQPTFQDPQVPLFGPDELASFAQQLGAGIVLTVNVGTGTAQEAAGWIAHWKAMGVVPAYVEVGNEMYVAGPTFPAIDPVTYAQDFDAYAQAIRAVDPTIRIGAIGTLDTSSWCYPNCATHPWNEQVLTHVTQKIDFFAVHNSYAPGTDQDGPEVFRAMLAYPAFLHLDDTLIANDIDLFGNAATKGCPIAITEHASFFLGGAVADNQTWAAALFSALEYDEYASEPRVQLVTHINPLSPIWEAPVAVTDPSGVSDPAQYDPMPTTSAFGLVFEAYRALAGASFVPVALSGSPAIDTTAVGLVPALAATPLVDSIAARGDAAKGWVFLVNRSLDTDLDVTVLLANLPPGAATLRVEVLAGDDYLAKNQPAAAPGVRWTQLVYGALPAGASQFGTTITLPKATLVRISVE